MIEKFDFFYSPAQENRHIHLYLPDEYGHVEDRYPVLYMFDGQNLFFDQDATYGKSWGLKEFLDHWHKRLIVVGIESGPNRLSEFSPYDFSSKCFGKIKGIGDTTMQWIVNELKPYIDSHYRTWWHREATAIAGSSMGGLMALFGILRYNRYFSKAAAISPAVGFNMKAMKMEVVNNSYYEDNRLFFSWGTHEMSLRFANTYGKNVHLLEQSTRYSGFQTQLFRHEGGTHCEACWEQEVPLWMHFLWEC